MSNYPKLIELYESIVTDSYAYLIKYSSDETKASIEVLRGYCKNVSEIIKMSYILLCSFNNAYENLNKNILNFTQTSIEGIYYNLIYDKNDISVISNINDCCEGYISLFGYRYIFEGVYDNEYLAFSPKYYETFYKLLKKYNIEEEIKNYYENIIDNLIKLKNNEIDANFFDHFVRCFQKDNLGYQKNEKTHTNSVESTGKENNGTPQANQNYQINSSFKIKTDNKNSEIKVLKSKDKTSENKIEKMEKELIKLKNKILFIDIKDSYDKIMIFEKIILNSELNLTILNIEQKKNEYLDNVVKSLKNIIRNFDNHFNFNFWRKLSNIILKNILVILHKKKFILFQYYNSSISYQLTNYRKIFQEKEVKLEEEEKGISYNNKLISYENELNKQKLNIKSSQISIADKPRNNNIIVVKNNVKYSLSIEFLFFLKEKGNKMDHFAQEIIDLILFDDLNIKLINNEETCNQKENENKEIFYDGKTNFTGDEILEIFKNPLKYHKKEIDINKIYECVYNKIKEIKNLNGYIEDDKNFSDLKSDAIQLEKRIDDLIISYENYFLEKNINYGHNFFVS